MKLSRKSEIKLIFLLALALVVFLSLLTFDSGDINFLTSTPNLEKSNIAGFVGAYIAWMMLFLMGMGAYIVPFFIAIWGIMFLLEQKSQKFYLHICGALFSILAISSILSMIGPADTIQRFARGGIVGLVFSDFLLKYLGSGGTSIVITVLFLLSFLITTDFLVFPFVGWIFKQVKSLTDRLWRLSQDIRTTKVTRREENKRQVPAPARLPIRQTSEHRPIFNIKEHLEKLKPASAKTPANAQKKKSEDIAKLSQTNTQPVYDKPYEMPTLDLLTEAPVGATDQIKEDLKDNCLLYTSPSPRDGLLSRMPSSA